MAKDLEKIGKAAKAIQRELESGYTRNQKFWEFVNRHKYGTPFEVTYIPNYFENLGRLLGDFTDKYHG